MEKGKSWVELELKTGNAGVEIWAKALPQVEAFFLSFNQKGRMYTINQMGPGNLWYEVTPETPLKLMSCEDRGGLGETVIYAFYNNGQSLIVNGDQVNLSWLRAVGISGPEGIRFGIKGVMSAGECRRQLLKIETAIKAFIKDHLVPFKVSISVMERPGDLNPIEAYRADVGAPIQPMVGWAPNEDQVAFLVDEVARF